MQVSVEKTSELSRKMTVTVPEELIQEKMAARLKSLAREVKIDGFRPGKAPQQVVKKIYGSRVRDEITGDLIQSTYYEALEKQDLKPVTQPNIHPSDLTEGFEYVAEFEVYPDISLEGLDQLELARPTSTVQDADVDDMIEKLRNQKKTWVMVDRPAQEHDRLGICFSGTCEGVNFTDGKVENYRLEIGSKQMIPDFEENLIGLMAGDNKVFELTFPENHSNQELAGKQVEFDIEVLSVEEPVLPEIDDAFIQAYGIEGSLDTFRDDIRTNLENELKQALYEKLKNVVTSALYEKIRFSIPVALINQEIKSLMEPYIETAKRQKLKLEDLKLSKELFEETAKRRVAVGLILTEIIQKNNFKVDDRKVRTFIEDMAKNYERPVDVVNWYFSDENRLDDVRHVVLENQTIDWLIDKANVTDVTIKFSEAMNKQNQGAFNV